MPRRGVLRKGDLIFAPNWDLGRDLRRTHNFDPALLPYLAELELAAREIAVREAFDTGAYFASIHGEMVTTQTGQRVGMVTAADFKANWIERGWTTPSGTRVKGRNILRRAARRAGLRYRSPRRRADSSS